MIKANFLKILSTIIIMLSSVNSFALNVTAWGGGGDHNGFLVNNRSSSDIEIVLNCYFDHDGNGYYTTTRSWWIRKGEWHTSWNLCPISWDSRHNRWAGAASFKACVYNSPTCILPSNANPRTGTINTTDFNKSGVNITN